MRQVCTSGIKACGGAVPVPPVAPRGRDMRADLILLTFAYVLSQFYRAFLAVLTEVLDTDIGAGAEALATASGLWFLSFALM